MTRSYIFGQGGTVATGRSYIFSPISSASSAFTPGLNISGLEVNAGVLPGIANTDFFVPQQSDIVYFASKGLKKIRLPVLWQRLQPTLNGPLSSQYLGYITQTVALGYSYGMEFLIDIHNYCRYGNGANTVILGGPAVGGLGPLTPSCFVSLWTQLATALKGMPGILGYDIQNEPYGLQDSNGNTLSLTAMDALWSSTAQSIINAIGAVDPNTPIYVEGLDYSDCFEFWINNPSFANLTSPYGNKIVIEGHTYLDRDSSGTYFIWANEVAAGDELTNPVSTLDVNIGVKRATPFIAGCQQYGFACCIGEMGAGNNDPNWNVALNNLIMYCEEAQTPIFYFCGGNGYQTYALGVEPTNGVDTRQMAVLCYYTGVPDAPSTYLLSGPSRGTPSTASTAFTVDIRGIIANAFTITLNDGGAGGTFSPAVISVAAGFNFLNANIIYTPPSTAQTIVISGTNTGGLTDAPAIGFSTIADLFATLPVAPNNVFWPVLRDTTYIGTSVTLYRVSDGATKTFNYVKVNGTYQIDQASINTWKGSSAVTAVQYFDQGPYNQSAVPIFSDNQSGPPAAGTTSPGTQLNTNVNQYPTFVLNAYNNLPALRFAGSKMDAYSSIAGDTGLTIFIAANPNTLGDGYCMMAWDFVQNIQFCDGSGNMEVTDDGGSQYIPTGLTPGILNIYAFVFNGTANTVTTYCNGVQISQETAIESSIEFSYRQNFNIGYYRFYPSSTNFDLFGLIDISVALTPTQVSAFFTQLMSDAGIVIPGTASGLTLNGTPTSSSIAVVLPTVPANATSLIWQYRLTNAATWITDTTATVTAGSANAYHTYSNLSANTSYDFQVVPANGGRDGASSQLLAQKTIAATAGNGTAIAHLGFNIAGLDLNFSPNTNVSYIQRFGGYGFNVFRVPFAWETLYTSLPSAGGTINSAYVTNMLNYVSACQSLGAICLLDLHNYAKYNGVYFGSNGGPTTQDLVTTWVTLASTTGIKNVANVRIGMMNEPGISLSQWAPIHNAVVAGLRAAGITNVVHASDQGGNAFNPVNFQQFTDSQAGGTIWEIHLYTDGNRSGTNAIPAGNEPEYMLYFQQTAALWRGLSNPSKLFIGECGFDPGTPAQTSLTYALQYIQQNADVYDGLTFWCAGQEFGSGYIYDMNQTSSGTECPTTLQAINYLPGGSNYRQNLPIILPNNIQIVDGTSPTFTAAGTGPFPNSKVMNGSVWETTFAFCTSSSMRLPPTNGNAFTIEIMFQSDGNSNTSGFPIFGSYNTMCAYLSNTVTSVTWGNGTVNSPAISMTAYYDGKPHHFAMSAGPAGLFFFVDGHILYSNTSYTFSTANIQDNGFQVGYRADGGYYAAGGPLQMALGNLAIWITQKYTAAFTPPTDYYTGMEPGLIGYWPMNGDTNERL